MLNQRVYNVDRCRDFILTYINVESTLSVCWAVYVVNLRKLKITFSSNSQDRTRKSEGSGLLQLCFCLSVYLNNFSCIFLLI